MEDVIVQEADALKDELSKMAASGKPVQVPTLFHETVNSVLWRVVTGRPVDKPLRKELTLAVRKLVKIAESKPLNVLQVTFGQFQKNDMLTS